MHPLNGALPGLYVPVPVACGVLDAHRYTYAPPRSKTSQNRRTFILLSVSFSNDLEDLIFDGVGLVGFKSRSNNFLFVFFMCFFIGLSCSISTIVFSYFSLSLLSVNCLALWGWGLRTDKVYITLSQPCTADRF